MRQVMTTARHVAEPCTWRIRFTAERDRPADGGPLPMEGRRSPGRHQIPHPLAGRGEQRFRLRLVESVEVGDDGVAVQLRRRVRVDRRRSQIASASRVIARHTCAHRCRAVNPSSTGSSAASVAAR